MQRLSKDGVVFKYDEKSNELSPQNHTHNYEGEVPDLVKTSEILNKHDIIKKTVPYLAYAGFKDICVAFEKDGILGFTKSHHSLHISARKPN